MTTQHRNDENFLTPEQFGAYGNGTMDDSPAFHQMLVEWSKGEKAIYADGDYLIHSIRWRGLDTTSASSPLPRRLKPVNMANATLRNTEPNKPMFVHPRGKNMVGADIRIGTIVSGDTAGPIWRGQKPTTIDDNTRPAVVGSCHLHFGYIEFNNPNYSAFDCDWGDFGRPKEDEDDLYEFSGLGTSFQDCLITGNEWRDAPDSGSSPKSFFFVRTRTATTNDNVFAVKRVVHRSSAHFFDIGCTGRTQNQQLRFDGINFQTNLASANPSGTPGGGLIALYGARNFEIKNCLVFDTPSLNNDQIFLSSLPAPFEEGTTRATPLPCELGVIRHYRRPARAENIGNQFFDLNADHVADLTLEHCDVFNTKTMEVRALPDRASRLTFINSPRVHLNNSTQSSTFEESSLVSENVAVTGLLSETRRSSGAPQIVALELALDDSGNATPDKQIEVSSAMVTVAIEESSPPVAEYTLGRIDFPDVQDGERLTLSLQAPANTSLRLVRQQNSNATAPGKFAFRTDMVLDSKNDHIELIFRQNSGQRWCPVSELEQRV